MTLQDLLLLAKQSPEYIAAFYLVIQLSVILLPFLHGKRKGGLSPWALFYSILTYLVCIPGMVSAVLLGYGLFFRNQNLLEVNLLIYFLPLVAMLFNLYLIGKQVNFVDLPGSERLLALMILLGGSFGVALVIHKLFIGIIFTAPLAQLTVIALSVFVAFKWAWHTLMGSNQKVHKWGT